MAEPGDEIAASAEGRGHLRASLADREQAVNVVKAAFVQGLLAKDEFDLRIGQVFAARTYAQLAALTVDIPAGLTAVRPLSEPAPESAGSEASRRPVSPEMAGQLPMPLATLPVDRLGRLGSTDGLPGRSVAADRAVSWNALVKCVVTLC